MSRWESNFSLVQARRRVQALEAVFSQPLTEAEARATERGRTYALMPAGESLVLSPLLTTHD